MDLSLVLLGTGGVCCLLGAALATSSFQERQQARQLAWARPVSLSDEHSGSSTVLGEAVALAPLLVAVTGQVFSQQPLAAETSGKPAAILKLKEEREFERLVEVKRPAAPRPASQGDAGRGQEKLWQQQQQPKELEWVIRREVLRSFVQEAPWGLAHSSTDSGVGTVLAVVGGASAAGDYMHPEEDRWEAASADMDSLRMSWIRGYKPLGVRTKEWALPLGTMVHVVGELATQAAAADDPYTSKVAAATCVLRAPQSGPWLISRRPIPELVSSLDSNARASRIGAVALVGLGACLLAGAAVVGKRSGSGGPSTGLTARGLQLWRDVKLRILAVFNPGRQRQQQQPPPGGGMP